MAHGSRIHCHDRSMYTPIEMKMQDGHASFFPCRRKSHFGGKMRPSKRPQWPGAQEKRRAEDLGMPRISPELSRAGSSQKARERRVGSCPTITTFERPHSDSHPKKVASEKRPGMKSPANSTRQETWRAGWALGSFARRISAVWTARVRGLATMASTRTPEPLIERARRLTERLPSRVNGRRSSGNSPSAAAPWRTRSTFTRTPPERYRRTPGQDFRIGCRIPDRRAWPNRSDRSAAFRQ